MNGRTKKKYFPNKWSKYKAIPSKEFYRSSFFDIYDSIDNNCGLLPQYKCVIRATHFKTKKVTEHVYKREHAAHAKFIHYLQARTHDLYIHYQDEPAIYFDPRTNFIEFLDAFLGDEFYDI